MGTTIGNTLQKIPDYKAIILDKFLEQYKGKPNWDKMLNLISDGFTELENVFWDLYIKRWLESSEGTQLDNLGDNLSVERQGLSDDNYRQIIYAKIGQYNSNGRIEDILNITKLLTNASLIEVNETFPAKLSINIIGDSLNLNDDFLESSIKASTAGGVGLDSVVITENLPYFKFQDLSLSDIDADASGFSSLSSPNEGGYLSELL